MRTEQETRSNRVFRLQFPEMSPKTDKNRTRLMSARKLYEPQNVKGFQNRNIVFNLEKIRYERHFIDSLASDDEKTCAETRCFAIVKN